MKFKHTFNVFVDNFAVTYKQLLYRIIIDLIAVFIIYLGIFPFIRELMSSESFVSLIDGIKNFFANFFQGEVDSLSEISLKIRHAFESFITLLQTKTTQFILSGLLVLLIMLIKDWFLSLGNFAAAALVNDKMSLHTNSPFLATLIKNLKEASLYSAIYVPLSTLYNIVIVVAFFCLMFFLVTSILPFFICLFIFVLLVVLSISLKMTFTTDWLPAIIRGKMGQREAFVYAFSRKNKNTANVFSNFTVIILLIFALNVATFICTLGVGILISVPSSYVIILSFELVNYYDREEIKYFIDKNTIIKPAKEHTLTREEFFRGDSD